MNGLRHLLHPLRSIRAAYQGGKTAYYKRASERAIAKLPREKITRCWCGGSLAQLLAHPRYGACAECGCYVNLYPPTADSLKEFYSLDNYWRLRQRFHGIPPIEKRAELYWSDGRVKYWLHLIKQYGPGSGNVIEIGCAPGILLSELTRRGYKCIGVEPDASVAAWIRRNAGVEVVEGLFPRLKLPSCDLLLAFDVAEHSPDPVGFWKEIARLLEPGGVAIVQTPIEYSDYAQPFKTRPEFFDGQEHLYLYTDKSVRKLIQLAGLDLVTMGDAMGGYLSQFCVVARRINVLTSAFQEGATS